MAPEEAAAPVTCRRICCKMLIFRSQGWSCLCFWTTLKDILQPLKPLAGGSGRRKIPPKLCSSPDSVTCSGRCWKHNHANFFGSTPNDFCVDGATTFFASLTAPSQRETTHPSHHYFKLDLLGARTGSAGTLLPNDNSPSFSCF